MQTPRRRCGVVGVQVLNEFTNVARRKLRWQWGQIEAALAVIDELLGPARPLTSAIHARAVVLARDHDLPFYDALIVASGNDCSTSMTTTVERLQPVVYLPRRRRRAL